MTRRSTTTNSLFLFSALSSVLALAGCPEPLPTVDAGLIDTPDPIDDAGTHVEADGGDIGCPTVTAFMAGESCPTEGLTCRSILCIFPGPACLELTCVDGIWRNGADEIDAGSGPDAGELPIRTVGEAPLFRGLPVDNLFLDPELTLGSSAAFNFYNAAATNIVVAERVLTPDLPLGTNALRIRKSTNQSGVIGMGAARMFSGPGLVEIDLGRPVDSLDVAAASIALVGVFADGSAASLPLVPAGDARSFGEIRWQRYVATFEEGPVAWAYLVFSETHGVDLYIAAPVLVALDLSWSSSIASWAAYRAERRPLTESEALGLARVAAADRHRLSLPTHRQRPEEGGRPSPPRFGVWPHASP